MTFNLYIFKQKENVVANDTQVRDDVAEMERFELSRAV